MASVKTFVPSERCQSCGAFKREHIGFALVCPPLPKSRPVANQRDVREPRGAPPVKCGCGVHYKPCPQCDR